MNDFLPASYTIPVTSSYMKLKDGDNKFRILGKAVVGMEYWKTENGGKKLIHKRMNESISPSELEISTMTGELEQPKHFWAFPVFSYESNKIEILDIPQKRAQKAIMALVESKEWGDPTKYDITIHRSGQKAETTFSAIPSSKMPLSADIQRMVDNTFVNMENIFAGKNPLEAQTAGEMNPSQIEQIVSRNIHTEDVDSNDIPF